MRRITLVVVAVLLAVVAPASAKVGVEMQKDPGLLKPGEKTGVLMMVMNEPKDPSGDPQPVVGVRPLATFRNAETGDVIRVRGGWTNRDGIAHAAVAFPSKGHWSISLTAPGLKLAPSDNAQEFQIGIAPQARYVDITPPVTEPAAPASNGFPWLPLGIGLAALALAAFGAARLGPRHAPHAGGRA